MLSVIGLFYQYVCGDGKNDTANYQTTCNVHDSRVTLMDFIDLELEV